jgi:OOP family OmpA-OmpF porin
MSPRAPLPSPSGRTTAGASATGASPSHRAWRLPPHILSRVLLVAALWTAQATAGSQPTSPAGPTPPTPAVAQPSAPGPAPEVNRQVVVRGLVPDEATRAAVLARLRALHGPQVIDQMEVAPVATPPQWADQIQRVLSDELLRVREGELRVEGSAIQLSGQVAHDGVRQALETHLSQRLTVPSYQIQSKLRTAAAGPAPGQQRVDRVLAGNTVEFEPGSAVLTAMGRQVLDALWPVLASLDGRRFEVIGHTDSDGLREANLQLSLARAEAVRQYLMSRGLPADRLQVMGAGPDHPIADNRTAQGRARNRRIEIRVLA